MLAKIVAAAAVGVLLAGCSSGGGKKDGPPVVAQGIKVGAGEVGVTDPAKPIATAAVDSLQGKAEVAVLSLTARGKLAQLSLSITLHSGDSSPIRMYGVFGIGAVASLVDPVNLKRYLVVKDSAGHALGSDDMQVARNGPTTVNYTFAAPPENVAAIDVQLGDLPPFRNVPISR